MKHLVVDISAHGFGHLAQTTAVLNELDITNLHLTIRSRAPVSVLHERLVHPFDYIPYQQDNGMVMLDALRVDASATMQWYQKFHDSYSQHKTQAALDLTELKADLLFCDIPYLSLDAAALVGMRAVALCSLNWADIFQAYCGSFEGANAIHAEILNAYEQATCFLQARPSMPMLNLSNTQGISPIALTGIKHASTLQTVASMDTSTRFILVALGGIGMQFPLQKWPQMDNICWIFDDAALYLDRDDFIKKSQFGLSYIDLLASCDLIITKTGYGTQTETVINQVPTLCVKRADWPEEPYLSAWHQQHGEVEFIDWQELVNGEFMAQVKRMLAVSWQKEVVKPTGAIEAASVLYGFLSS